MSPATVYNGRRNLTVQWMFCSHSLGTRRRRKPGKKDIGCSERHFAVRRPSARHALSKQGLTDQRDPHLIPPSFIRPQDWCAQGGRYVPHTTVTHGKRLIGPVRSLQEGEKHRVGTSLVVTIMIHPHLPKTPTVPETTDEQDTTLGMLERDPLPSGPVTLDAGCAPVQARDEKFAIESCRGENDHPGKYTSTPSRDSGRSAPRETVSLIIRMGVLLTVIFANRDRRGWCMIRT